MCQGGLISMRNGGRPCADIRFPTATGSQTILASLAVGDRCRISLSLSDFRFGDRPRYGNKTAPILSLHPLKVPRAAQGGSVYWPWKLRLDLTPLMASDRRLAAYRGSDRSGSAKGERVMGSAGKWGAFPRSDQGGRLLFLQAWIGHWKAQRHKRWLNRVTG